MGMVCTFRRGEGGWAVAELNFQGYFFCTSAKCRPAKQWSTNSAINSFYDKDWIPVMVKSIY